jgi:hypothetical protein
MAQTIAPAVGGREQLRMLAVLGAGAVLGATLVALMLLLVGAVLLGESTGGVTSWTVAAAMLAVVLGWTLRATFGFGLPYPRSRWQVPEQWRHLLPPLFTAFLYGLLLGVGFLTDVELPTYWVMAIITLMWLSVPVGLAIWVVYAVIRMRDTGRMLRVAIDGPGQIDAITQFASHKFARARAFGALWLAAIVTAVSPLL